MGTTERYQGVRFYKIVITGQAGLPAIFKHITAGGKRNLCMPTARQHGRPNQEMARVFARLFILDAATGWVDDTMRDEWRGGNGIYKDSSNNKKWTVNNPAWKSSNVISILIPVSWKLLILTFGDDTIAVKSRISFMNQTWLFSHYILCFTMRKGIIGWDHGQYKKFITRIMKDWSIWNQTKPTWH